MSNQKKGILLVALAVMAITAYQVRNYALLKKQKAESDLNSSAQVSPPPSKEGFGKFLKSPRVQYKELLSASAAIPKGCVDYFDALQRLNMLDDQLKLSYQNLPTPPAGEVCPLGSMGFEAAQAEVMAKCNPKDQNLSEQANNECMSALFLLRAKVTRLLLKDKKLSEMTDMHELADLMFAEFGEAFGSKNVPDFSKLKAVSERMLQLDPHLYAAAKVSSMSDAMTGIMSNKSGQPPNEAAWKDAEASLARAQQLRPNDHSMEDAEIAVRTRGFDPVQTQNYSEQMIHQNQNNAKGWFLLAYSQWKQNDREASFGSLKRAMEIEPQNKAYAATWAAIHKPNATMDSFQGSFMIGIDSSDFNN